VRDDETAEHEEDGDPSAPVIEHQPLKNRWEFIVKWLDEPQRIHVEEYYPQRGNPAQDLQKGEVIGWLLRRDGEAIVTVH
jgi:hypothetical protein